MKENIVLDKSFQFALDIIELNRRLISEKEFVISKQLLRSGTSIGANVQEATAAESRKDFIHKMAIASKEARETQYWLLLLDASRHFDLDVIPYLSKANELVRILTSILKTSTKNSLTK